MIWFLQMAQLSTTISARINQHCITRRSIIKSLNITKPRYVNELKKKKTNSTNCEKTIERNQGQGLDKYLPQAQRATAFHFLISKRLLFFVEEEGTVLLEGSPAGTMGTSESKVAMASEGKGIARYGVSANGAKRKYYSPRLIYKLGFDTVCFKLGAQSHRPMNSAKRI